MDSQRKDILSYYQPLIQTIENFRGPEAYILDVITEVSSYKPKVTTKVPINNLHDVINLLSMISTNRL